MIPLLSQGNLAVFFERPLAAVLSILAIVFLLMPVVGKLRSMRKPAAAA